MRLKMEMQTEFNDGWFARAEKIRSEHYNKRPAEQPLSLLVIHNISLPPNQFGGEYIEHFFTGKLDPSTHPYFQTINTLKVSAHFLIQRTGRLIQFVSTEDRAWHAGVSNFEGVENCNDYSIGIELEGADNIPYTPFQYGGLEQLTKAIMREYPNITVDKIVGHCDIAPGRKTDPGKSFDWQRYKRGLTKEPTVSQ